MAKSFEGLSRTNPRGMEPAGRESPREPLLTAGRASVAAGETLSDMAPPSLSVSAVTLEVTLHLFFFHSQEMAERAVRGVGVGC